MAKEPYHVINNFRLNRFVIKADVQNGWMLYNTATGAIVFIHGTDDLQESLDKLIEMYFYVPTTFDEVRWVNELRTQQGSPSKEGGINSFTILTTTDCNARCFYCYEKGQAKTSMTEKTANDVAHFIMKSSNTPIDIRWFGGEPLVNMNVIDMICSTLTNNGVRFKSRMVTNGLLFTSSIIIKAKNDWNLKRVQITLDGTKEVYQKSKAYKDATGDEFEKVIDNINKLTEAQIRVSIRFNQGAYNTLDLLELIDTLAYKFKGNKLVSVYNRLLYNDNAEFENQIDTESYERFKLIQDKLIKCGLYRNNSLKRGLRCFHCMADSDSSIIITPNGKIGKCEHFTDQHFVGNIYDPKIDFSEILKWKERYQPTQKCFKCPLYPQCIRIRMCPEEKESCSFIQCENKIELITKALKQKYKLLCGQETD